MSRFVMFAVVFGVSGLSNFLAAQDATPDAEKRNGPLPAHYKDIVTPDQRAKIYSIQDDYRAKIDAITAQLKALQAERDAKCESVLSPEQKEKLTKARADAAAKRAAATAAAKKPEAEAAPAKVETPPPTVVPPTPAPAVVPPKSTAPAKVPATK